MHMLKRRANRIAGVLGLFDDEPLRSERLRTRRRRDAAGNVDRRARWDAARGDGHCHERGAQVSRGASSVMQRGWYRAAALNPGQYEVRADYRAFCKTSDRD